MKLTKSLFFLCIVFFISNSLHSQDSTASQKQPIVYYYIGKERPRCLDDHPEKKYGFIIEWVGGIADDELLRLNQQVVDAMDKKKGKNWTKNYIATYCN